MDIEKTFSAIGGVFLKQVSQIKSELAAVEAFIFDWDGVFNDGFKSGGEGSPFSEIDSMGINFLRFSRWLTSKEIPPIFIITGENNPNAIHLSKRECYNAIFRNFKDKRLALNIIGENYNIQKEHVAVVFDDILDIGIAGACRLAFCVGRKSTPLFEKYLQDNEICDYITGSSGSDHAVREICELILVLENNYESTLRHRIDFSPEYQQYLKERSRIEPEIFEGKK